MHAHTCTSHDDGKGLLSIINLPFRSKKKEPAGKKSTSKHTTVIMNLLKNSQAFHMRERGKKRKVFHVGKNISCASIGIHSLVSPKL